jgi:hypothetical protein
VWLLATKTIAETKNARRVLIEGNVIENVWADAQVGFAILLKSSNQDGTAPWSTTQDVTFRYNRVRNVGAVFNIAAHPEQWPVTPCRAVRDLRQRHRRGERRCRSPAGHRPAGARRRRRRDLRAQLDLAPTGNSITDLRRQRRTRAS